MIFDVAAASEKVLRPRLSKLREDLVVRLVQDVHQDVQPTAMGHAEGELLHVVGRALLDQLVEQRNERFAAVKAEPLLRRVARVEKSLEGICFAELTEDVHLLVAVDRRAIAHRFHALGKPVSLLGVLNVHELDADVPAVGVVEQLDDVAQLRRVLQRQIAGIELSVEIRLGQLVCLKLQTVGCGALGSQRVECRREVTGVAISVDQIIDMPLLGLSRVHALSLGCR